MAYHMPVLGLYLGQVPSVSVCLCLSVCACVQMSELSSTMHGLGIGLSHQGWQQGPVPLPTELSHWVHLSCLFLFSFFLSMSLLLVCGLPN